MRSLRRRHRPSGFGVRARRRRRHRAACLWRRPETGEEAIFSGRQDASEISSIDLPRELDNCRKLKDALWRAIRSVCESEDTTQYALGLRTFLDLNIIKYH